MTAAATGVACDSSVLVAALASWHARHTPAREAVASRVTALPAHVLLETYSVLTRLPAPHRVAATAAAGILERLTLPVVTLPAAQQQQLPMQLARAGLSGGAVYDALVGATARHHDCTLVSLDRRARATYGVVGASVEYL